MEEDVILRAGDIIITRTMAKFGSVTYPIAGIGSVYVAAPHRVGWYVAAAIAVIIGVIYGDSGIMIGPVVGIILAAIGFNRPYKLMLRTASGDQQALESRTSNLVENVKGAIERAVVMRG